MTKDELTAQLAAFLECGEDGIGEDEPFFAVDEFLAGVGVPEVDCFYDTENMVIWLRGKDGVLQLPFRFGSEGETRVCDVPAVVAADEARKRVGETVRVHEAGAAEARQFLTLLEWHHPRAPKRRHVAGAR